MDENKVTPKGIIVPRLYYEETKDRNSVKSITERVVIDTINAINNQSKAGENCKVLKLVIEYLNKNVKTL